MLTRNTLFSVLLLALVGCGDDENTAANGSPANPDIEAGCQHLEYGPDVPLRLTGESAAASTIHTRYSVTLGSAGDAYSGQFIWTSAGGHHYFLLDQSAEMSIAEAEGSDVSPFAVHTGPVPGCTGAQIVYEFMLPEGSYEIRLESGESELLMAIHKAGEDHDQGDHHPRGSDHSPHAKPHQPNPTDAIPSQTNPVEPRGQ